jgi:hypothetical protein
LTELVTLLEEGLALEDAHIRFFTVLGVFFLFTKHDEAAGMNL